ncbi:hypothetical protein QR680_018393 [Steinernema hermaphroditum]|uniref:Exonuclease 1 n=1 Tax=Steinernema hermaphroditum TaxID=289476 RepID=A0AA39HHU6_9BILA|nr:hypothetical protein QR680_018393 [Steinernema hermaphroditum]
MGIKGLLPYVKNACREGNISEFHDRTIAIDVSCYLHRGIVGCMHQISQGKETDFYVHYVLKYVKLLLSHRCNVIMVFDGRPLPAKREVNDERRARREENRKLAEQLMKEGKMEEAQKMFRMTSTITAEIVEKTIQTARKLDRVDIIVAPYEADAQLAYLTKAGFAHAVVTEDSDLIAFGCERIIFKLQDSGPCTIYDGTKLPKCVSKPIQQNFSFDVFRRICILAGCDYLQKGLPGVGLAKAETFFSKALNPDMKTTLPRIPSYLKMPKLKPLVTNEFVNDFERAEKTFRYQIVFDPRERCQKPLNPYPLEELAADDDDEDDDFVSKSSQDRNFKFAGSVCSPREAIRLALGNQSESLSKSIIQDKFTLLKPIPSWSIWNSEKADDPQDEEPSDSYAFVSTSVVRKVEKTPEVSRKRPREEDEQDGEKKPKKNAFVLKPKNGALNPWNADELLKMYGVAPKEEDEPVPKPNISFMSYVNPQERVRKLQSIAESEPSTPKVSRYFCKPANSSPRLRMGFLTKSKLKPLHRVDQPEMGLESTESESSTSSSYEKENDTNITDSLSPKIVPSSPSLKNNEVEEPASALISSPSNPFAYRASGLRRIAKN